MIEKLTWKTLLWQLTLFYLPWFFIGWLTGSYANFLLLGSVILIAWQTVNQKRLSDWLFSDRRLSPPKSSGSWEPLLNGLYRWQGQHRRKRRDLSNLIRRFKNGAESLPDAVVVFRSEGQIVWCNRLAQQLLGFRWPDDSEQSISNLIRSPDFIKYLRRNEFDEPLQMRSPRNVENILEFRIVPYTEGEHLMVVRDITQLRQLEGMRRNFFANVSHELRTPMTVLKGYLEMMEDPAMVPGLWPKAHGVMTEQLNRMNGLVEQLLTLSKIEAAPHNALDNVVEVPKMLSVLEDEAVALSGGRHKIVFDVDTELRVFGDEDQLRSAMSNLVYNAVKYCGENATINVTWKRKGTGVLFSVKDNGVGIEAKHLHRLTERFYRVDKARSRESGGSGLGLAIVKHALNHHESMLQVESEVGKGSHFYFEFLHNWVA
ncbi:phosphate regulon sensor histidine kinase PhoR [Vibrio ulleungensis]|uniref:Phosphate regulon sensor protein PhoR n=1 Tax=Vibrio ulleungensis TaxID=2807619 RepID=A0ABS2HLF5_9VIBR|nr:phosphate regulon sensor histidine kinase PhoR [Vibrio ulleungensis]MBM7038315.1 phosphate regulon sensor histidine kinase PhoR [Vibrio ulleungensis]